MKILVNEKISQHKYKTPEGYLICVDSVLARTGNQTYRKNELFVDSEDDSEIEVGRSPEEVFSAETLASFENKPITIEHPDEDVNIENYKDYSVGFVRDVKQGKFDGQDVILGTLVITDKDAIEGIENGEHVELSCGYDCDIEDGADGYQQKHIRGNHVALCEAGRAGIAKIIDSVEVKDERTSMTKEITKAISGLKSTLFKTDFVFESDAHGMTLTATDSYGIDPAEKSQAMRFVELDVKAIESRLSKITGYTVTIAKYSLYKERYSDPNAGLNCERVWLYGKKIRDSIGDVEVKDAKKYAVEFIYGGDSWSRYLGRVWVYANSEKEALKKAEEYASNHIPYRDDYMYGSGKIVPKAYSNSPVIDSIDDAVLPEAKGQYKGYEVVARHVGYKNAPTEVDIFDGKRKVKSYFTSEEDLNKAIREVSTFWPEPPLTKENRKYIENYLSMISGFVRRKDTDIQDVLRPLYGKGYKPIVEKVEGWIWKKGEMAYKNYYISLDGYRDTFKVTLYADPNKDWKVTEVNAYFTDSVKDASQFTTRDLDKLYQARIRSGAVTSKPESISKKVGKSTVGITFEIEYKERNNVAVPDELIFTVWDSSRWNNGNDDKTFTYRSYKEMTSKYREVIDYANSRLSSLTSDSIVKDMDRAIFYKRRDGDEYILSIDPQKIRENGQGTIYVLEQDGLDFPNPSDGNKLLQANTMGSSDALQNYLRKKGKNCKCIDETLDEEQTTMLEKDLKHFEDVDPRSGESKEDFIARFMEETKDEYPNEKQRLAVAYSYWENKRRDSMVKDINPDYADCLRELDKDVNQLYKLYQHGDKAPSTILHNMGYKEVGDDRFMMRSGLNKMIIEFDDFSDYIKYYVVDESGKIPRGYTITKFKFYDSMVKDSIYAISVQGQKSRKLVRAKDAREAIDKYNKMFPKDKIKSVKKTDKFNNIIETIGR